MAVASAAAAVVAGALLTIAYLASRRESPQKPPEAAPVELADRAPGVEGQARTGTDDAAPAEAAAGDVRSASDTFRNGSFLIAIRRAGYYCDDVTVAYESADGVWVASCMDKGGYLLAVRDHDRFDVKPIPHYFDGVVGPVLLFPDDRDPAQHLQQPRPIEPQLRPR